MGSQAIPVATPLATIVTDDRGSTSSTGPGNTVNIVLPKTPNKDNSLKFLNFGMSSPAALAPKPSHEKALSALTNQYKKSNAYDKWRELLEETADVNAKSLGDTALVTAARRSEKKVVKMLIEAMADVNLSADDGDTALIWAARKGEETIVKLLVEAKADVNMPDNDGNTPLACAQAEGHEEVINYLKVAVEEAGPAKVKKSKHGRSRTATIDVQQIRSRSTTRENARDGAPKDGSDRGDAPVPRDTAR
jgi:ankyrin repeat protein